MKKPLSLLRKGSTSRRLWESPPVPTERYELRPCLCVFVARFDHRIFLLFVKNGFVVGVRCQGNSEPPADGATTPLSQCHTWLRNAASGVEVGREGWGRVNNSLLHTVRTLHRYHAWNGTSEEGTKRGLDGARERKEGLSERRKEGAGREGATEQIEEWGKRAREAGILLRRTWYYKWKIVNWYINSVLWCVVMYCLTGRWNDFMWWQLWTWCIWHVLGA